jgi:hypothetical protein
MVGAYEGTLDCRLLNDGRQMEVLADFAYVDTGGLKWPVPKGAKVDGASIPRFLWPVIGAPWSGKYRDASVIHDWYCDRRNRPWEDVHRMFYEAMLTSGVSGAQARTMFLAVYYAGPRWSKRVVHNANIRIQRGGPRAGSAEFQTVPRPRSTQRLWMGPGTDLKEFERLAQIVNAEELPVECIEKLVDSL